MQILKHSKPAHTAALHRPNPQPLWAVRQSFILSSASRQLGSIFATTRCRSARASLISISYEVRRWNVVLNYRNCWIKEHESKFKHKIVVSKNHRSTSMYDDALASKRYFSCIKPSNCKTTWIVLVSVLMMML